ncbi:MAG: DedA family protein [Gemmatimonadetes bacterium]|nr:DedA family protein [Gemmatimonadota bacterium]
MPELIEYIINALLGLPPTAVYTIIGVLAGVENVFPLVPADTAVAIGAFLSTGGHISAQAVFAVTWVANVAGAIAVYAAGRTIGRPFFQGRLGRRLLNPGAMVRLELLYRNFGMWGIFVSRFVPGLRAVVPPFAGVANLGALRVVLPLVVASGLWYGVLTFVAATAVREIDGILEFARRLSVAGVVSAGALVAVVVFAWRRRRRRRLAEDGEQARY